MKKVSLLTWIGFIINVLMYGVVWLNFVVDNDAEYYSGGSDIWYFAIIAFSVALSFQVIAVLLLSASPKWGRVCAVIGAIIMAPIGLLFLMGYMSSYEKTTNVSFTPYKPATQSSDAEDINPSVLLNFKTSQMFLSSVLMIVMGGVVLVLGLGTGGIIVGAGILALVNGFRLNGRVVLGIAGNNFIATPGIYSDTYTLPFKDVAVVDYKKNYIKLRIKAADKEKVVTLRKNMIDSPDVDNALSNILSMLNFECATEHNSI